MSIGSTFHTGESVPASGVYQKPDTLAYSCSGQDSAIKGRTLFSLQRLQRLRELKIDRVRVEVITLWQNTPIQIFSQFDHTHALRGRKLLGVSMIEGYSAKVERGDTEISI